MTTEMNVEEQQQLVGQFLQGLAKSFGIEAKAENVSIDDDSFEVNLAGEDKEFIKKFMTKSGQTIFKPALAEEIFSSEDFIK